MSLTQLTEVLDDTNKLKKRLKEKILVGSDTYDLTDAEIINLTKGHPIWVSPPTGWGKKKIITYLKGYIVSMDSLACKTIEDLQTIASNLQAMQKQEDNVCSCD